MADVIKSYLVSISAHVDKQSFDKFTQAMTGAEKTVSSSVGGILGKFLAFEVAGIAAFASVGFGLISYLDKLAMLDRKQQILAMQNMMSVQQYRSVSMALDAMGESIENVMWGTVEMKEQFRGLIEDQKQLTAMIGPDYEDDMKQLRAVIYQVERLELKGKEFGMLFAHDLLVDLGFGQGGVEMQLQRLNDYVMQNMPHWAEEISTDVIPVLADLWQFLKEIKTAGGEMERLFIHLMGSISGDIGLKESTGSFHDFAKSIGVASHEFGVLIDLSLKFSTVLIPLVEMLVYTLEAMTDFMSGHPLDARTASANAKYIREKEFDPAVKDIRTYLANNPFAYNQPGTMAEFKNLFTIPEVNDPHSALYRNLDFQRIVMGVMQTESGGHQYGPDGKVLLGKPNQSGELAIGVMQLLPSTAKMLGVNPYNESENFLGGEKLLAQLLYQSHGDIDSAVAHYLSRSGNLSDPDVRKYVQSVKTAGGVTVGSITINVPATAQTPHETTQAVKNGVSEAMDNAIRMHSLAVNGAYAGR